MINRGLLILIVTTILSGCGDLFLTRLHPFEDSGTATAVGDETSETATITIDTTGGFRAQSILPESLPLSELEYRVALTGHSFFSDREIEFADIDGVLVVPGVAIGEWTITVTAYHEEEPVFRGSRGVSVQPPDTFAHVALTPIQEGTGTVDLSLGGFSAARMDRFPGFKVTGYLRLWGEGDTVIDIVDPPVAGDKAQLVSSELPSGTYELFVGLRWQENNDLTLVTLGRLYRIVHVRPNRTTSKTLQLTEAMIASPPEAAPSNIQFSLVSDVNEESARSYQITWEDNSRTEEGFEITFGDFSKVVGPNVTTANSTDLDPLNAPGPLTVTAVNDFGRSQAGSIELSVITFNGNSPTGNAVSPPTPILGLEGGTVVAPAMSVIDGFLFVGWSEQSDGTGTNYSPGDNIPFESEERTLYGQWASALYPFTSFTFTNGTQTGRTGPSRANLLASSAYNSTQNSWLENTDFFDVAGGIQIWTVPQTGIYRIEAAGAQGFSADANRVGGAGAVLRGEYSLEQGQKLRILVGQEGSGVIGGSGGGGGGTFVTLLNGPIEDTEEEDILMIAGGGGGTRTDVLQNGCPGRTSELGGTGSESSQTHNCGEKTSGRGEGGIVSEHSWGSGGGGFFTEGVSDYPAHFESGQAFIHGRVGGSSSQQPSNGGFGGGGSGEGRRGGGGGGGFSGGDGGRIAGGGGSFVGSSASNVVKTNSPGNSGHGSVMIIRLHGDD